MSTPSLTGHRMRRFVVVGSAVAALQVAISYGLLSLGIDPAASAALAFTCAFVTAYGIHRIWTFSGSPLPSHLRALGRYGIAQAFSMLAAALIAHSSSALGAGNLATSVLATVVAGLVGWILTSRWAFRR